MSTNEEHSSTNETVLEQKKSPYYPPQLVEYGNIATVTQGAMASSIPDMIGMSGGMGGMMM